MKISALASFCIALDDEELFDLLSAILHRRPEVKEALASHWENVTKEDGENGAAPDDSERGPSGKRSSVGADDRASGDAAKPKDAVEDTGPKFWIHGNTANAVFGGLIVLNAITIGIFTDNPAPPGMSSALAVDAFFLIGFTIELGLRFHAEHCRFWVSGWNNLDFVLVSLGFVDFCMTAAAPPCTQAEKDAGDCSGSGILSSLRVLRILRLLKLIRVVRLIRMFQDLWVLVLGLMTAMKALIWLFLLLVIFMYVCAIVLTSQVGKMVKPEDPDMCPNSEVCYEIKYWFGSVGESMFRLFQVMTGEDWPNIAEKTSEVFPAVKPFLVIFILFSTFALMNLVTGIIVDKVMSTAKQCAVEQEEAEHADGTKDLNILRKAFKKMCNKAGALDLDHFTLGLEKPEVLDTLKDLDIFLGTDPDTIFNILDINGSGTLDEMEFARGVLRMKGSTQSRHLLFVQNDLHKHCKRILNMSQEISNKLVVEAKRASHVQDHLDQIWHFMRRQASNRWITDPFHSSLHQMISEIYLLTREMHEKQKGEEKTPEKASPQKH